MFMKLFTPVLLAISSAVVPVLSLPAPSAHLFARQDNSTEGNGNNPTVQGLSDMAQRFPDMQPLADGNQAFRTQIAGSSNPNLLKDLTTNGQHPEFLFLGCSDSRVSEGTVFFAPPGALFTQRNIANQFQPIDNNAISVLSYGVQTLNVGHVIVMGHYGCGGVQASMLSRPDTTNDFSGSSVQSWINPIRHTFLNSTRPEIVAYREAHPDSTSAEPAKFDDPAFRALVEENVKDSVFNIVISPVMQQHWTAYTAQNSSSAHRRAGDASAALKPVYIHGFVYDISTGEVTDLGVSFGPHGATTQAPPQEAVKRAVDQQARAHTHL
jgi:carbonic anhydrase